MQLWLDLTVKFTLPIVYEFGNTTLRIISIDLMFICGDLKIPFVLRVECEVLISYLAVIPVLFHLNGTYVGVFRFL